MGRTFEYSNGHQDFSIKCVSTPESEDIKIEEGVLDVLNQESGSGYDISSTEVGNGNSDSNSIEKSEEERRVYLLKQAAAICSDFLLKGKKTQ